MLADNPLVPMIPSTDVDKVKSFYADTLGLKVVDEEGAGEGVTYESGGARFDVYKTRVGVGSGATVAAWLVKDLDAEVKELQDRGVTFEEYDFPDLKTENGIATLGPFRGAWFKDPEGNILGLFEDKR